jgi:hypothetical protein
MLPNEMKKQPKLCCIADMVILGYLVFSEGSQVIEQCPGKGPKMPVLAAAQGRKWRGRTLVERNLVESPFLRKPDFGRIHFSKFGLW